MSSFTFYLYLTKNLLQVENIHTMAELKMTGNCLRASRPLLSFDQNFTKDAHWQVMKELFTQIFGVPNHHPKSQPFFDHVFTFCIVDDKVTFCNCNLRHFAPINHLNCGVSISSAGHYIFK